MFVLTDLEVYNSFFKIKREKTKFELYRYTSTKFGVFEIKDELEEILNIPHITNEHLQDDEIGPRIID